MSGEGQIDFFSILDVILIKKWRILTFALVSCFLFLLVVGGLYLFSPREVSYVQDIRVLLPLKKDVRTYPNDRIFNPNDILSPLVLQQVYSDLKLESEFPFKEFSPKLSIFAFSPKIDALASEYQAKLTAKNVTSVSIGKMEEEYQRKLEQCDDGVYRLTFSNDSSLDGMDPEKILNQIPLIWANIFRNTEARAFPKMILVQNWEEHLFKQVKESRIMALDNAKNIDSQMIRICSELRKMQQTRNIRISSGESIDDIEEQLAGIVRQQVNPMEQMLLETGKLPELDLLFIRSRIYALNRDKVRQESEMKYLMKSLDMLQAKAPVSTTSSTGNDAVSGAQYNIGDSILTQLAEMSRKDAMNEVRKDAAANAVALGKDLASTESNLTFYEDILKKASGEGTPAVSLVTESNFEPFFSELIKNIKSLNQKLEEMKDVTIRQYYSSSEFYVPVGPMWTSKEYSLPVKKIAIFSFLLLFVINTCYIIILCRKELAVKTA